MTIKLSTLVRDRDTEFTTLGNLQANNNLSDVESAAASLQNLGLTATASELNTLDGITANVNELNILDGVTANTSELNILDGVTANTSEINVLDGLTANTTELNYVDGVTSDIQTQLNAKMTPTYTGDVDITGELIVDSYNETYVELLSSSNTVTIDCEAGNSFAHTLTEATTVNFINAPAANTSYTCSLEVIQDGAGSGFVVTWANTVIWPGATAPTLTSANNAIDVFVFSTKDGGTTWYGFTAGQALG